MKYEDILKDLAPCGLSCSKCVNCATGEIAKLSNRLMKELAGFEKTAGKLAGFLPVFEKYSDFREVLGALGRGDCQGCRQGGARFPLCAAKTCFLEKGVDFCFQCNEYPCSRNQYDPVLKEKWLWMNQRMKELGVEKFYEEQKDKPRY